MLQIIPIFSAILFAVLYPLGFWIHTPDPIVPGFRRFNLGLSCFVGGLGVVGLLFMNPTGLILYEAILWIAALLLTTAFYWNKDNVNPRAVTVAVLLGIILLGRLHPFLLGIAPKYIWVTLIGGGVLCGVVFATVLGHWYLNVPGLPLAHLTRAVNIFWGFVILRTCLNLAALFVEKVLYQGEFVPLFVFMRHTDGFLLWVALLFGTLLPLICNYFVLETIRAKSTQSATGILYAILIAVFMGDLTYKYYLVKFGIAL